MTEEPSPAPTARSTGETSAVAVVLVGLAAGFLSGIFGVGGGILMVPALVHTAIAGAVLALSVAAMRGRVAETLNGTSLLVMTGGKYATALEDPAVRNRFAYAPAIAVGAILTASRWWV